MSSFSHRVVGRMTPSDFVILTSFIVFILFGKKIKFNRVTNSSFFLLICFSAGLIFTKNLTQTFVELLAHLFLILTFLIFIQVFTTLKDFKHVILTFSVGSFLASAIGIWDLSTVLTGYPEIVGLGLDRRLPSGTFRNGGQAGAYMLISFSLLFALLNSKLIRQFSKKEKAVILISCLFSLLYIFFSAKIAAFIGIAIGIFLYIILNRKFQSLIYVALFFGILFFSFKYLLKSENKITSRIVYKYNTRIKNNLESDEENSREMEWMEGNFGTALKVFAKYPIAGSGIGGFQRIYHINEVHSTPLKLLGEAGLLGVFGYLLFMSSVVLMFMHKGKFKKNQYNDYLRRLFPLFLGCLVSWGYTYHLRKREFWIMISIIFLVKELSKVLNRKLVITPTNV